MTGALAIIALTIAVILGYWFVVVEWVDPAVKRWLARREQRALDRIQGEQNP